MIISRRSLLGATAAAVLACGVVGAETASAAETDTNDLATWGRPQARAMSVRITALGAIYYPSDLSSARPGPLVVWGNGTGAVPSVYRGLFEHWVSWGYVVYAAGTPNPATGIEMRLCIDDMERRVRTRGSEFHRSVDLDAVAAVGHSQGGQAALNAAVDIRIRSAIGIQPGPLADVDLVSNPILLLTGTEDRVVPPSLYVEPWMRDRARGPMVYGSLRGATHFEPVSLLGGTGFQAVTTA